MDPRCYVEMLGPLRVIQGGQVLTRFPRQKAAALLAYLALRRDRAQPREALTDLFWPDLDGPAGRDNLSTVLSSLRRLLEPVGVRRGSVLVATHQSVGLNPVAVTTDVAEFERLLDEAARAPSPAQKAARLGQAAGLYQGEFLAGCYDDWAVREGERLGARLAEALPQWSEALEQEGDLEGALRAAQQWLATDAYCETAHVRVAALQVGLGRGADAQGTRRAMEALWREEFGAPLPPKVLQRLDALLTGSLPPRNAPPGGRAGKRKAVSRPAPDPAPSEAVHSPAGDRARPLPIPLDRFLGRESDMARLAQALLPGKDDPLLRDRRERPCRLVTLVGPGGVGKTRLAVEFAAQTAERFGLRCHFISLAETEDFRQILSVIVGALPLPPGDRPPLDRLAAFFAPKDRPAAPATLLILDNLEQLLGTDAPPEEEGAASEIGSLLAAVPLLTCLCTSRRRLGLRGERLLPVEPLPIPVEEAGGAGAGPPPDLQALLDCPSVRLYVDRAQAVRADFGLTSANASSVAALCRLLDGSPLALELAASWVRTLPPRQMWERLSRESGLGGLEARYADLPARQRSLRAALDWSWRLLRPSEQRLLARLSIFRGGWTLEAAEGVCEEPEALDLLTCLEEASFLRSAEGAEGEVRWRFLETVRQYVGERLRDGGGGGETRRRHAEYFLTLAKAGHEERRGPEAAHWLSRLEADHDNMRAALDRCGEDSDDPDAVDLGLGISTALRWFWATRGYLSEGRGRLMGLLAHPGGSPGIRARALLATGMLFWQGGALEQARGMAEEALAILTPSGDTVGLSDALWLLGSAAASARDWPRARECYEQSLALSREIGDGRTVQGTLGNLGHVAFCQGDRVRARALAEESLALARAGGNKAQESLMLNNLGGDAYAEGDLTRARALAEASLALSREMGRRNGFVAETLELLSDVALGQAHPAAALAALREGLLLCRESDTKSVGVRLLEKTARLVLTEVCPARAACLLGSATALRAQIGMPLDETERAEHTSHLSEMKTASGETAFESAWAEGQAMPWEQAVEYAQIGLAESVRR